MGLALGDCKAAALFYGFPKPGYITDYYSTEADILSTWLSEYT